MPRRRRQWGWRVPVRRLPRPMPRSPWPLRAGSHTSTSGSNSRASLQSSLHSYSCCERRWKRGRQQGVRWKRSVLWQSRLWQSRPSWHSHRRIATNRLCPQQSLRRLKYQRKRQGGGLWTTPRHPWHRQRSRQSCRQASYRCYHQPLLLPPMPPALPTAALSPAPQLPTPTVAGPCFGSVMPLACHRPLRKCGPRWRPPVRWTIWRRCRSRSKRLFRPHPKRPPMYQRTRARRCLLRRRRLVGHRPGHRRERMLCGPAVG